MNQKLFYNVFSNFLKLMSITELRQSCLDGLKNRRGFTCVPKESTLDYESFLTALKVHPNVYKASLSRQFASDFPEDIHETTLKDEPKDWYIKTADFGDEHDRILQHRDGEYTQLFEDIHEYHQIFQQGCDQIIVLRSPDYGRYDILINAAMQCLGYSPKQFQFLIVQPFKLFAFHTPSQKVLPIPDLPTSEIYKLATPETLRWHASRYPLTDIAPLNISGLGKKEDPFVKLQSTLQKIEDATSAEKMIQEAEFANETKQLHDLLQKASQIREQSINDFAPNLLCRYTEKLGDTARQTLNNPDNLSKSTLQLLQKAHIIIKENVDLITSDSNVGTTNISES